MILPIFAYGSNMLRKETEYIDDDYPNLPNIIADMYETMYKAKGVGLAAPQIGLPVSLFIIDSEKMEEENSGAIPIKQTFINPEIIDFLGENTTYSEGCLSVPGVHEDVIRKESVRVWYQDENFNEHEKVFTGMPARIIQHDYDHLLGKTFVDRLSSLKKTLLKRKLRDISTGKVDIEYKMRTS